LDIFRPAHCGAFFVRFWPLADIQISLSQSF
jgi:hypothetical protein